jgi:hypothetical protein
MMEAAKNKNLPVIIQNFEDNLKDKENTIVIINFEFKVANKES